MRLVVVDRVAGRARWQGLLARVFAGVRVHVEARVVAAADVHGNCMSGFERIGDSAQGNANLGGGVRSHRLDFIGGIAVAKEAADRCIEQKGFVSIGIHVDQLDHEVGVRSIGRAIEIDIRGAGYREIVFEWGD